MKRILKIANFDKIARYEALCVSIRENGWRHHLFAIEVGARGYCAYNVRSCFRRLGLNTKETKVVLSELTSTAIQCSFVIWLNRDNKIWNEQVRVNVEVRLIYLGKLHENILLSKVNFLNIPMQNIHNLYLNSIDQDSLIRVILVT